MVFDWICHSKRLTMIDYWYLTTQLRVFQAILDLDPWSLCNQYKAQSNSWLGIIFPVCHHFWICMHLNIYYQISTIHIFIMFLSKYLQVFFTLFIPRKESTELPKATLPNRGTQDSQMIHPSPEMNWSIKVPRTCFILECSRLTCVNFEIQQLHTGEWLTLVLSSVVCFRKLVKTQPMAKNNSTMQPPKK